MNEQDLKAILARNPSITVERDAEDKPARLYIVTCKVPPPEPERREENALDGVVQRETPGQVRPIVRFVFYRVRLLDADARAHGCKDLLDGLVEAGVLPGDREDQIDFDARQEKVHYKKDERTEIQITLP